MDTSYTPVAYDFRETIEAEIAKGTSGKIFFFNGDQADDCMEDKVTVMEEIPGKGIFITLDTSGSIRIDRIITLFGKPVPAYEAYDAYANACLSCTGSYDL